ncbi:hypothetical protein BGW36DRAFT_358940 [Talaromyces proteolyticus]|uniref:Uncharacterized protein n=1 Tax=Talaromyces proteolyticus TaxID=1131652 RepID=A0AAD4KNU2_9EURO|nr:uncharacterized protein BGW36DRAFT_358940 [Talaromyces proteolyticus]KAH8697132.1 hypothetical protein BGW36DRAFT_358940 [Talaromyces proteolyticus]
MGFAAVSLDCDVKKSDSRKEENQERAFVAASRRKDRTLDARLESANRASMLHKKRTGKALLITKDIVENEAMYEEIDERYQEKRMKLLKDQTNQLEAQFHRHLVATLAISHPNGTHQMSRISPTGGIQKVRGMSPAQSYFAQQAVAPMSPLKPDPASATFGAFALPSPPAESYVQTHQPYASYMPAQVPMYMSTPQLNPSWNTTSADAVQSFLATQQPINSQEISQPPPFRSRFASVPDVLLYQQQQNMALAMPDVSRAQSEPHQSVLETNEGQMASAFTNFALTPDLSPHP